MLTRLCHLRSKNICSVDSFPQNFMWNPLLTFTTETLWLVYFFIFITPQKMLLITILYKALEKGERYKIENCMMYTCGHENRINTTVHVCITWLLKISSLFCGINTKQCLYSLLFFFLDLNFLLKSIFWKMKAFSQEVKIAIVNIMHGSYG